MSVELEKLLGDCADAGVVFYVRFGAVSLRMMKGPAPASLLERIGKAKADIKTWLTTAFSVARCIDCPRGESCAGFNCSVGGAGGGNIGSP